MTNPTTPRSVQEREKHQDGGLDKTSIGKKSRARLGVEYDDVKVKLEISDNVNKSYCVGLLDSEEKTAPVGKCTQASESAKTGEKITDEVKTKDDNLDNLNEDLKGEETKRRKKKEKKRRRKVEKRKEEAKKREEDAERWKEEIEATDAPT